MQVRTWDESCARAMEPESRARSMVMVKATEVNIRDIVPIRYALDHNED
jgi:hypothetical protein